MDTMTETNTTTETTETTTQTITTKDLVTILKSHRGKIIKVELEKVNSIASFYQKYAHDLYARFANPTDYHLRDTIYDMYSNGDVALVNKQGRFLKRLAKCYSQRYTTKLTDSELGIIGDRLQYYVNRGNTYYIDFTDSIDWEDGQFGKDDSCWWGCYKESKDIFLEAGGWGLRFYDNDSGDYDNGIGRTWILPHNNMLVGFNSYGIERPEVMKVLKAFFKSINTPLECTTLAVSNSTDAPYINSGTGFVVYANGQNLPHRINFKMGEDTRNACVHCGNRIDEEDEFYYGDSIYCQHCYDRLFSACENCEETYPTEDLHEVLCEDRNQWWCENCTQQAHLASCDRCTLYTDELTIISDRKESWCAKCTDNHACFCAQCEQYHADMDSAHPDTSGLIESQETLKLYGGDEHNITLYRVEGVNDLVFYNDIQIYHAVPEFVILHVPSSLIVASKKTWQDGKQTFIRLASIVDWSLSKDEILLNDETLQKIRSVIYS